jgi:hypothetical protein
VETRRAEPYIPFPIFHVAHQEDFRT